MTDFERWLLNNHIQYEKIDTDDIVPAFGVSAKHEAELVQYTLNKKYEWKYRGNYNYVLIKVFE